MKPGKLISFPLKELPYASVLGRVWICDLWKEKKRFRVSYLVETQEKDGKPLNVTVELRSFIARWAYPRLPNGKMAMFTGKGLLSASGDLRIQVENVTIFEEDNK